VGTDHRTRAYRDGKLIAENFPTAEISDHLAIPGEIVWLDMCEPDAEDFQVIAEEFDLEPLAVEDAMSERQRPKVDHYDDHLFLSLYAVRLSEENQLFSSELAVFVAPRFLITVRKDGKFDMERVVRAWDGAPDLASSGVGYLLWGLLDVIVDGHFTAVEALDERLDDLESELFDDNPSEAHRRSVQRRSFQLRKSLVLLRRLVTPMREVVNTLLRRELHIVDERLAPYYQDVYDHVLRAGEWSDGLRDLVGSIVETNLTIQGNVLNEIMKKLTSYAAIVAVPTAVTGFFGQNVHFPGFGGYDAFATSLAVMVILSVALYAFLKTRGWL
jgi:magnesium transporter